MSIINSGVTFSSPTACTIAAGTQPGSLSAGAYTYKITFVSNYGETGAGTASNSVVASANTSMLLTSVPLAPNGNCIARKIYRTSAGGSTYLLAGTIADNTTATYTDTLADASLGAAPPAASTADSLQIVNGYISFQRPKLNSTTTGITALAGGGQTGATLLFSEVNILTTVATAADSVILPLLNSNIIGMTFTVKNSGANSANVFPASGQTINALGSNTALAVAASAVTRFHATTASNWQVL